MPSLGLSVSVGRSLEMPVQLLCVYLVLSAFALAGTIALWSFMVKKKVQRTLKGRGQSLSEENQSPYVFKHVFLERGKGQFADYCPEPVQCSVHWYLLLQIQQLQQKGISFSTKHVPSTRWGKKPLQELVLSVLRRQATCPAAVAERESALGWEVQPGSKFAAGKIWVPFSVAWGLWGFLSLAFAVWFYLKWKHLWLVSLSREPGLFILFLGWIEKWLFKPGHRVHVTPWVKSWPHRHHNFQWLRGYKCFLE